jgi:hypothetical protein
MFGPFRLTNPLSGGLLWCVRIGTSKNEADVQAGKSHGASPDTKSTDTASASDTSIPSSAPSIQRSGAWARA